jgi:hypothetical protein
MKAEYANSLYARLIELSLLLTVLIGLTGCASSTREATPPEVTPLPSGATPTNEAQWSIYHLDPQHLWNRLFRQFFRRTTDDGREYGWNSLDPLLWPATTHLLESTSYEETIQLLDEFLITNGEDLITDPLKRALFQRDLWAVFDWLNLQTDDHAEQRQALQERIARMMKKLALTEQEILSLPDNYFAALASGAFPPGFQDEAPDTAFLPPGLSEPNSEWLCVGREGGPMAMTHTQGFPFFGRSAFLVFMRVPGGQQAVLPFLQELNTELSPRLPTSLEVALVRRTILIDQRGEMVFSPIVESIQIRHFQPLQRFYNFSLNRTLLFAGVSGGLEPLDKEILLFFSHGDGFVAGHIEEVEIPDICKACHIDEGLGIGGVTSILSYSRARFPLPEQPTLIATAPEHDSATVIAWKMQQGSWQRLQTLWQTAGP